MSAHCSEWLGINTGEQPDSRDPQAGSDALTLGNLCFRLIACADLWLTSDNPFTTNEPTLFNVRDMTVDMRDAVDLLRSQAATIATLRDERDRAYAQGQRDSQAEIERYRDTIATLRRDAERKGAAIQSAREFISNLRVPQNMKEAALQVFIGSGVLKALDAALADEESKA